MRREHPLRILRYSARNLWLLGIPLLRSLPFLLRDPANLMHWLRGVWVDLLVLLCILGFGWLRWRRREFSCEGGILHVREGIFLRRQSWLPAAALSSMQLASPFWGRPFGIVRLRASAAGAPDVQLFLRREDAARLRMLLPKAHPSGNAGCRYRAAFRRILLFSVLCSSSLSGALYTAVFWLQGRRIAGDLLEKMQLSAHLQAAAHRLTQLLHCLPPAAAAASVIVLAAWLLSLVRNLLLYGRFSMETGAAMVFLRSGVLTVRESLLRIRRINFLELRQNLLMLLLGQYALAVNCPGYGARGRLPVCLPLLSGQEAQRLMPLLLEGAALHKPSLRPPLSAWWGYLWAPLTGTGAVLLLCPLLQRNFPNISSILLLLQWILLIPLGWRCIVGVAALCTSGIHAQRGMLCLRICRGFAFRTVIADAGRIASVRILQYPWQRVTGKCHLELKLCAARPEVFRLKTIDRARAEALLGELLP